MPGSRHNEQNRDAAMYVSIVASGLTRWNTPDASERNRAENDRGNARQFKDGKRRGSNACRYFWCQ